MRPFTHIWQPFECIFIRIFSELDIGKVQSFLFYKLWHINAKCTVPVGYNHIYKWCNTSIFIVYAVKSNSLLSPNMKSVPN